MHYIRLRSLSVMSGLLLLGACVTINVYFPAAEVQRAADKLIDRVWGEEGRGAPAGSSAAPDSVPIKPSSGLEGLPHAVFDRALAELLRWIVPTAAAQANVDVSSPAIQKLAAQMSNRHGELSPFYKNGAVGLTSDGLITERDRKAVPLKNRQAVTALIAAENRDRKALYREIARVNGHPEWEPQVRSTFARRWISKAPSGWWFQQGGGWRQK